MSNQNEYVKRRVNAYEAISNDDAASISLHPAPASYRGAYTFKNAEEGIKEVIDGLTGRADHYSGLRFLHSYVATLHASVQYAMKTQDQAARQCELESALNFLETFGHALFLELADHQAFFMLHFAQASGRKIEMYLSQDKKGLGDVMPDGAINWRIYPVNEFPAIEHEEAK